MAVERARAATADMAELARVGVVQAMSLTHKWDDSLAQKVREEEEKVDKYEDALGTYLVKLSSREMSHADSQSVNTLLHTISDFERISDHSVNVLSSAEEIHAKSIEFSKDAQEELQVLEGAVQDVLSRTTDAFRKGDLHLAGKVEPLETVVDELVRAIKARHVARLQTGSCSIEYGFVLEDLLTFMGAGNAAMRIMEQRMYNDMRNKTNRLSNCETANMGKTVQAAVQVRLAIETLEEAGALETLPKPLQQAARLRMQYPEMPLAKLAEKFDPPVSKAGLSHRFKRIQEAAARLNAAASPQIGRAHV